MAWMFRWWHALLGSMAREGGSDRWVQPANEITRAISAGTVPALGARPAMGVESPVLQSREFDPPEHAFEADEAEIEVKAPAAQERAEPRRRRRWHRAA